MLDPISLTLTAASLASTVFGTFQSTRAAREQSQIQRRTTELEMKVEEQRRRAMELDARRRQMEILRQGQRARSMALTVATAQGASQGSVLGGAYGQITGQTNFNLEGVRENLDIGRNIFDLNAQISQQRIRLADSLSSSATAQGFTSFGSSLSSATPQLVSGIRSLPGLFSSTGTAV